MHNTLMCCRQICPFELTVHTKQCSPDTRERGANLVLQKRAATNYKPGNGSVAVFEF